MRTRLGRLARGLALGLGLAVTGPHGLAADQIDAYLEERIRALHIPGLSLAVVRDGAVIKARGYGLADLEHSVPATERTVYEIGSNTKQITAAAVMLLVEEGRLRLEDPLASHLPDAPSSWRGITLRHLLTHTSGIRNHVAEPGFLDVFKTSVLGRTSPDRAELTRLFFRQPLEFEPGATWAYDNTGYYLLGFVIEKASGMPFQRFLDERVFRPLGMAATRDTDPHPVVPNRASGYEFSDGRFENRPVLAPFVAFSAGCLLSNVLDLARWDAALRTGRLLKPASLERLWTAERTAGGGRLPFDYGLGWFLDEERGRRLVQHNGGTPGFSSVIHRWDEGTTVVILANHMDRFLDQLAIDVAGMVTPALRRPEPGADPDPARTARLVRVFRALAAGSTVDASELTPPQAAFLGTATGRAFWSWVAYHGELRSLRLSHEERSAEGLTLRYRAVLGDDPYWFSFRLSPDGRIAQILPW